MGRNEIRLRRQKMSSGRIAQHRNYGELMERHERDVRIKRVVRVFVYFLIILAMLIIFLVVKRWESNDSSATSNTKIERTFVGDNSPG